VQLLWIVLVANLKLKSPQVGFIGQKGEWQGHFVIFRMKPQESEDLMALLY